MKDITCNQYNSACTLSVETCAKRYQKATFNPDDMSLDPCRKCPDGKKNFDAWKDSFKNEGKEKRFVDMPVVTKKQYKCRFCGTPTVSAGKICLKCQIEGRTAEEGEEGIKATGNRHEDRGTRKEGIKEYNRKDSDQAGMTNSEEEVMGTGVIGSKVCIDCKKMYKPTSNVQKRCPECKAEHKREIDRVNKTKAAVVPQGNTGPNGGRESGAETYTITVDFSRFPKLHERLVNMADEEIRVPGDQLLFMLKNTLETMEERV